MMVWPLTKMRYQSNFTVIIFKSLDIIIILVYNLISSFNLSSQNIFVVVWGALSIQNLWGHEECVNAKANIDFVYIKLSIFS